MQGKLVRGVDLGRALADQARGQAFSDSSIKRAKITSVTNWATQGIRATFEDTGEVIACEARGAAALFDLAVNDYVWVRRLLGGKQNKWIIVSFCETSAGSFVPVTRTASLPTISSLDASDGSPAAVVSVDASGVTTIGDGTNEVQISAAGVFTLNGTAKVVKRLYLPIQTGGGTATTAVHNGSYGIVLDTDGETFYCKAPTPSDWDEASDLLLVFAPYSEIDEGLSDVISITAQVRSYLDGIVVSDAGQSVACVSQTQPYQDEIFMTVGTIDYDHGSYPIHDQEVNDVQSIQIKCTVNLDGTNEATGPIHIIDWWIEYTADRFGE